LFKSSFIENEIIFILMLLLVIRLCFNSHKPRNFVWRRIK